jgi:hypothetical protein
VNSPQIAPKFLSHYIGIGLQHPRDLLPTELVESQAKYASIFWPETSNELPYEDAALDVIYPVRGA